MYFIGVDLGTSGIRSAVVNENIEMAGEAYVRYPLIKISHNQIEQDAHDWWRCVKKVIRESVSNSGVDPKHIKGISISSQGISFIPIDISGRPLRRAITWLDSRADEQKKEILKTFSEESYFEITGKNISSGSVPAKILWIRENEPEVLEKTHKIFTAHDFIVYKLCGIAVTDHTLASGLQMYDLRRGVWSRDILNILNLDMNVLPDIRRSGSPAGALKKDIAQELGLSGGVMVAVGGQDQKCAALGAGISEGTATVSLGTAAAITKESNAPVIDRAVSIPSHPYLFENKWVMEGVVSNACSGLDWLKETFFPEADYGTLNEMGKAAYKIKNEVFFYPHFSGTGTPYLNKQMKGFIYGLSLYTRKEDIIKSVFEGVAYQIKTNLLELEKNSGTVNEIRIFGGGANNEIWCQIISDITMKKTVRLSTCETAVIGACILAAMAYGGYSSAREASGKIRIKDSFMPNILKAEEYERCYKKYLDIEQNICALMQSGIVDEKF